MIADDVGACRTTPVGVAWRRTTPIQYRATVDGRVWALWRHRDDATWYLHPVLRDGHLDREHYERVSSRTGEALRDSARMLADRVSGGVA